ncbi:hypothetical protein EX30DRAFT_339597 [Ascodesmis nigricans]|uniref:Mediator of RNA polymerase II transcription subunit 10 n=1 Tax=Ascodesmis nigricans TaxID=341454 RepID=A0A4S2N2Q7_9PEZI|nr:hypothetical protein EX30DRAFT_339597 [Ascodesmis nigricans]
MAPSQVPANHASSPAATELRPLINELETTIQDLYNIIVCLARFESPEPLVDNIGRYVTSLTRLPKALPASNTTSFPVDVIHYVEDGRNPDIYTREFVELVVRSNQTLYGRRKAYKDFRDTLASEIKAAWPDLEGEVEKIVKSTEG